MNVEQTISELSSLSITERIRIVAAVWDSLPDSETKLTTPEQDAELNRRLDNYRLDPSSSLTREEIEKQLSGD